MINEFNYGRKNCQIVMLKTAYTELHMFMQLLFWAGNQSNHQNFDPSLLPKKLWLIFMGMKQKTVI